MVTIGALVRFLDVGSQSLWFDEAHTVWVIQGSLSQTLARVASTETTPPLYFGLAWLWAHLFGSGAGALRSLSALFGVATIPVSYETARTMISRRAGLIVAALTACSPLLVWYSQEARSYALLALLSACTLLAVARLRNGHSDRLTTIWSAAAVMALATHYYAAIVVAPEAAWLLLRRREHQSVRRGLAMLALAAGALAILAERQLEFLATGNWIVKVPLSLRLGDVLRTFLLGPRAPAETLLLALSALAVIAAAVLAIRASPRQRSLLSPSSKLLLGGCLIVGAMLLAGVDQLDYRNLIALWLPAAIVLGGTLSFNPRAWVGVLIATVLCGVGLAAVASVDLDPSLQRPPWNGLAAALGNRPRRAIFMVEGCQLLPLSLYMPGLSFAPGDGEKVRELDVVSAVAQRTWYSVYFSGSYVVCGRQRSAPRLPRELNGFHRVGQPARIGPFRLIRLVSTLPRHVDGATFTSTGFQGELLTQRGGLSGPRNGYAPWPSGKGSDTG